MEMKQKLIIGGTYTYKNAAFILLDNDTLFEVFPIHTDYTNCILNKHQIRNQINYLLGNHKRELRSNFYKDINLEFDGFLGVISDEMLDKLKEEYALY